MNEGRLRWMFGVLVIAVIVWLSFVTVLTFTTAKEFGDFQIRQVEIVQAQNVAQLCAQHDIIEAIQQMAEGFEDTFGTPPLAHIEVPDVSGLDCP